MRSSERTSWLLLLLVLVLAVGEIRPTAAQEPRGEHLALRSNPPAPRVRPVGLAAYPILVGAPAVSESDRQFDQLVSEFLPAYFRAEPVRASALGFHEYDALFPATDSAGIAAWAAELDGYRARLSRLDPYQLRPGRRKDHAVLTGHIERELRDLRAGGAWQRDPGYYLAIASEGIHALVDSGSTPPANWTWNVVARLWLMPGLFHDARANLEDPSLAAAQRAVDPSAELVRFLANELPARVAPLRDNVLREEFEHHLASASGAAAEYHYWLRTEVVPHAAPDSAGDSAARGASAAFASALDSLLGR